MITRFYLLYIILLVGLFTSACREEDENLPKKSNTANINGYVQKGPYINGTSITVYELGENLIGTGKNFNTQITDNKGTFEIKSVELSSSFVQLRADGFYFDEVKGEKSAAQLTLYALADITIANSVNVNLLSHLEKDRVIYLIENGKSFSDSLPYTNKLLVVVDILGEDS